MYVEPPPTADKVAYQLVILTPTICHNEENWGYMTENNNTDSSNRAEIEGVKTLLKEAEAENRLLRWLLTATIGFMVYVVYRFS